jgi:hypothetical protein
MRATSEKLGNYAELAIGGLSARSTPGGPSDFRAREWAGVQNRAGGGVGARKGACPFLQWAPNEGGKVIAPQLGMRSHERQRPPEYTKSRGRVVWQVVGLKPFSGSKPLILLVCLVPSRNRNVRLNYCYI